MPSRFCLLPGRGTLSLAQGLASWLLQAYTTDRPPLPVSLPHQPPSVFSGLTEARQMVFAGEKVVFEK